MTEALLLERIFSLIQTNQTELAKSEAMKLYKREGHKATVLYLLGLIYHQGHNLKEAERFFKKSLREEAGYPAALSGLGIVHLERSQNRRAVACFEQALKAGKDPSLMNNLALAYQELGDTQRSIDLLRTCREDFPDYGDASLNLGKIFAQLGQNAEAIALYEHALQCQPDMYQAHYNLGHSFRAVGETDRAKACYEHALKLTPSLIGAWMGLVQIALEQGHTSRAHEFYQEAARHAPMSVEVCAGWGELLLFEGRQKEAFERLAPLKRLSKEGLPPIRLHRLGEGLDALGEHEAAFTCFQKAHDGIRAFLKRMDRHYKPALWEEQVDRLCHVFSQSQLPTSGLEVRRPVFVVGLPRSGTSLVEQILASHSSIYGAGELAALPSLVQKFILPCFGKGESLQPLEEHLATWAQQYESALQEKNKEALYVVDKLPHNFQWVGVIHMLFPQAVVIHVRRSPLDTCLSLFRHRFTSEMVFQHALGDLGHYYRHYHRLMSFWEQRFPGKLLPITYETLVRDPKPEIERMLEALSLPWEEACLRFHETQRTVKTASRLQVRTPLYTTAVGQWKKVDKHLAPLKTALGEALSF